MPARFLYSLPQSLVGRRQVGTSPVPPAMADRYALTGFEDTPSPVVFWQIFWQAARSGEPGRRFGWWA
jgi:hypothetical protein